MTNQNVAVIGMGMWGKNIVRNFYNLNVLEYVCDLDEESLKTVREQFPGVKTTKDFNEIINNPYQILVGEQIRLSASIGIVTYPIAGETFEALYNNLLLTTYVSKRDGGNKFTDFYASIGDEETSNMEYFQEVKGAIQRDEFTLYYQPIIDMENNLLQGCECLMRWNHPEKGVQSPATFLKVLEQSGDIGWVGRWGLQEMIKTHDMLAQKFVEIPLRFSLNLSTKQLLDPELANTFIDIINKTNSKPENYMLEISDFMMLEKIAVIRTNVYKLRDFGFKIAVDGFEIDGQSVQVIQRAPIDVIKLGRSFLKDIENNFMKERLLEILVKYATENNRTLISEGVETPEIAKYVKDQNVFLEQGYLFGKPMSQEAFNEYLEKHQYKVILEDVTNIEDTEKIMRMVGGSTDSVEEAPEEEISAEDLLSQTVAANGTVEYAEEADTESSETGFEDFLDDDENN